MYSRAVSRSMNFDNPPNTVYKSIKVEQHLSESWLFGSPIICSSWPFW